MPTEARDGGWALEQGEGEEESPPLDLMKMAPEGVQQAAIRSGPDGHFSRRRREEEQWLAASCWRRTPWFATGGGADGGRRC